MKNIFLVTFSFIIFSSSLFCQMDVNLTADSLLKRLVTESDVVGVSGAYSFAGNTIWKSSNGYSDRENKILFSDTTLTRTASIAKPMTAVAIMQLVEQGKLDLDLPIQHYLPEYPIKKKGSITTRHLLTHTSGMAGYKSGKEAQTTKEFRNLKEASEVFEKRKLKFKPGTKFSYTTYGYVVLGQIIETVSGLSYEDYMQTNIWNRVNMKNTGVEKYKDTYPNKSKLYQKRKNKVKDGQKNNLSNRIPGGGFYSTVNDILKFGNGLLENTFIADSTFQLMMEMNALKKEGNPYGLGWYLYGPAGNQKGVI